MKSVPSEVSKRCQHPGSSHTLQQNGSYAQGGLQEDELNIYAKVNVNISLNVYTCL